MHALYTVKSKVIVSKFQISYTTLADMHNLLDIYHRDMCSYGGDGMYTYCLFTKCFLFFSERIKNLKHEHAAHNKYIV